MLRMSISLWPKEYFLDLEGGLCLSLIPQSVSDLMTRERLDPLSGV